MTLNSTENVIVHQDVAAFDDVVASLVTRFLVEKLGERLKRSIVMLVLV